MESQYKLTRILLTNYYYMSILIYQIAESNLTSDDTIHKIIIAGLDSVGKTSVFRKAIERVDVSEILDLPTTKGIERQIRTLQGEQIVFWDLGGQEVYRSQYFQDSRIFTDASVIIYVLDIQDQERFDESLEYLLQILMIIKNLTTAPRVFVLFHKFDPEKMKELRKNLFEATKVFKEVSKIPSLQVTNFSTSIFSNNLDHAIEKILQTVIPNYSNILITPDKEPSQQASSEPRVDEEKKYTEQVFAEVEIDQNQKDRGEDEINKFREDLFQQFSHIGVHSKDQTLGIDEKDQLMDNSIDRSKEIQRDQFIDFHQKLKLIVQSDTSTSIQKTVSETVEPLIKAIRDFIESKIRLQDDEGILNVEEITLLRKFMASLDHVKSEIWHLVEDQRLKSYEIDRQLPILFENFTTQLIKAITINEIITPEERSLLNQSISKIIYIFDK